MRQYVRLLNYSYWWTAVRIGLLGLCYTFTQIEIMLINRSQVQIDRRQVEIN